MSHKGRVCVHGLGIEPGSAGGQEPKASRERGLQDSSEGGRVRIGGIQLNRDDDAIVVPALVQIY